MATSDALAKHRRSLTKAWLRWRLPFVAGIAVVAVAGGGLFGWEAYRIAAEDAAVQTREAERQVHLADAAKRVSSWLAPIVERIDAPRLAAIVADGDSGAIEAAEAELTASDPAILGTRLLPLGVRRTDYSRIPSLSYAALDLLRQSEETGEAPAPEVHLFGEPGQHIAVVRRLEDADGKLLGHVLTGLDVAILQGLMPSAVGDGLYLELQQPVPRSRALALASVGDRSLAAGQPAGQVKVRDTAWQVVVWDATISPAVVEDEGGASPLPLLAGGAAGIVLLGAAVVMLRRRRRAALDDEDDAEETAPVSFVPASSDDAGAPVTAGPPGTSTEDAAPSEGDGPAPPPRPTLPAEIFRAYDVRGIVDETLTTDVVRAIGRAIGSEAYDRGQQTLVVGRDGRRSSPELAEALIEGFRATGRDAIDIGQVPTPVLYFATHYLNTGSGVMITGSHNPANYNGLKMMLGGDTLFGDDIQALRERIERDELGVGDGGLQQMEIIDEYIRRVTEDVPVALGNAFKLVVDCGNGVAGDVAPKLYRALGHDVVELYCDVDGTFPNHHPDPSQPENLVDLIAAVKENGADLGLAFDGDGDRLGVVDPEGHILWPDLQMMLFARDVLSRNSGAEIIFDVKCSAFLPKVISKLGGKPVMWKTGHSFIKNKLKESGAPLAGEMSGHIFFQDRWYGFDDAIYAGARLLELLMNMNEAPSEIFAKLPRGVATPELRVDVAEGVQLELMEKLRAGGAFSGGTLTTIDGIRIDYENGWGLVRASNTTPSLVLRFEAGDEAGLNRIKEQFRKALLDVDGSLVLPF